MSNRPPSNIYRDLMLVGLLGAIYRCTLASIQVSMAVEMTLANPKQYRMCRAIALGMGGDATVARLQYSQQIEEHPEDDASKVALGVSLLFAGDREWRRWFDNVLATSLDQDIRAAAHGVLDYLEALRFR